MGHAFAVRLPRPVLSSLHAFDQWLASLRAKRLGLQRHELLKVSFKIRPCYRRLVLEQDDVGDCFSHLEI